MYDTACWRRHVGGNACGEVRYNMDGARMLVEMRYCVVCCVCAFLVFLTGDTIMNSVVIIMNSCETSETYSKTNSV